MIGMGAASGTSTTGMGMFSAINCTSSNSNIVVKSKNSTMVKVHVVNRSDINIKWSRLLISAVLMLLTLHFMGLKIFLIRLDCKHLLNYFA